MRFAILLLLVLSACAQAREPARPANCLEYETDIQPLLLAECESCHGEALAGGGYRVDSYVAVVAPDAGGIRRARPGDATSTFLTRVQGENDHPLPTHGATLETLERWLLDCNMSYLPNELVHPAGWVLPGSDSSHAAHLRSTAWDLEPCSVCHGPGDDPSGGAVQQSCTECHANGPTGCDTCHGDMASPAPPRSLDDGYTVSVRGVGVHRAHLFGGSILAATITCDDCHVEPFDWRDAGHVFDATGALDVDGRAEIVFGPTAAQTLPGRALWRDGPPTYNLQTGTCTEVYCHGGVLPDERAPSWTPVCGSDVDCETGERCVVGNCVPDAGVPDADLGCTLCHSMPPGRSTHAPALAPTDCVTCHATVVDAQPAIINPALHLDGALSIGDGSESCSGCHGSPTNAAPPTGLAGETSTNDPAVGAHQVHLNQPTPFAGPLGCHDCHVEPGGATFAAAVGTPGHVDSALPAEVFPGGGPCITAADCPPGSGCTADGACIFVGVAARRGASPTYDATTTSCSDVHCHGGSTLLSQDTAPGVDRSPIWTNVVTGRMVCGSCHGIPPTVGLGHLPSHTLTDCVVCHSTVVDLAGAILFDAGGNTRHINGKVDFNQ